MEKVKISKVVPNENNPRFIKDYKFKKLVQSIQDFPEMLKLRPIVVNTDMVVLGGNMRLKACKEAGLKEVYILKADELTEQQQREFIVKDNVGFGEWDWDILANEWDNTQLKDWGMDVWQPEEAMEGDDETYVPVANFDDEGVGYKSQFGVITECKDEVEQERVFKELTAQGLKCKIVVT